MECCLGTGELIRLEGGQDGLTVRCGQGTIWLTKGDGVDYLLTPGRNLHLGKRDHAIAEALSPSQITLIKTESAGSLIAPAMTLARC